jgi:TetR/AcrR family transcriptional regulator, regulator of cefoperazone and chloramphenicol sensitivity
MAQREDGRETRSRILDAASKIFAEKGYQGAKVADICRAGDANVAAVNYYFGDKATLYAETWQYTFQRFHALDLPRIPEASAADKLRAYVDFLVLKNFDRDDAGRFTRLYLMELVNPTGLIQDLWHELIEPRRRQLQEIIAQLLGNAADGEKILFCEMSIISQCRALSTTRRNDLEFLLDEPLNQDLIRRLADHITRFSLAGIQGLKSDE